MNQSEAYRNLANQRSFFKTKILFYHSALPHSVHFLKSSRTSCPNWTANSQTSGTIFGLCPMADAKLNPWSFWIGRIVSCSRTQYNNSSGPESSFKYTCSNITSKGFTDTFNKPPSSFNNACTVKPVLSGHSKRMLQESILQYFRPSLRYHLSLRPLFCLFLSGQLRQVLLYNVASLSLS